MDSPLEIGLVNLQTAVEQTPADKRLVGPQNLSSKQGFQERLSKEIKALVSQENFEALNTQPIDSSPTIQANVAWQPHSKTESTIKTTQPTQKRSSARRKQSQQ